MTREAVGKPVTAMDPVVDAEHPPHCQDVEESLTQEELMV
jgi:hypothetical protein